MGINFLYNRLSYSVANGFLNYSLQSCEKRNIGSSRWLSLETTHSQALTTRAIVQAEAALIFLFSLRRSRFFFLTFVVRLRIFLSIVVRLTSQSSTSFLFYRQHWSCVVDRVLFSFRREKYAKEKPLVYNYRPTYSYVEVPLGDRLHTHIVGDNCTREN